MSAARASRPDAGVVAAELARRIDALVIWLGLAPLVKTGGCYAPLNPTRGDRHPGSFVIYAGGHAKAGGWVDYVDPDRLKGDALDLVGYILTGDPRNRRAGYEQGLRFLGWEGADALTLPHQVEARAQLERDRKNAEERAARELLEKRRKAFQRWREAEPLAPEQPAWRYLVERRGLALEKLADAKRLPGALRFLAEEFHAESKQKLPCLIALLTSPDGKPWGTHRTFLAADGSDKAGVEPQRKIWPGGYYGGAIRLSKGASNLSPEACARDGLAGDTLVITEGVETGLSVALACPEWRVWAAGALGAQGHVVIPACVETIILAGENNSSPEARTHWGLVVRRQALQAKALGAALYTVTPPHGDSDFNDVLQRLRARAELG